MTTRDVIAKAMTEDELLSCVVDMARKQYGWRVAHFRPARTNKGYRTLMQGDPGFPDLVLAKEGRVLFVELKSERGELSAEQEAWLFDLDEQAKVWRPSDWLNNSIERILRGES